MWDTVFECHRFLRESDFDARRLVFVDESHTNDRSAEQNYGNSMIGQRPVFEYYMVSGQRYVVSVAANSAWLDA